MKGQTVKVTAHDGVALDCYLALPSGEQRSPALVLSSGMFGVTRDVIDICEWWASRGFIAAAPEQWARGDKGPLGRTDSERAWKRIRDPGAFASAKRDVDATLSYVRAHPRCNRLTALLGFCFGGPLAVAGIVELGCDAGAAYHSGGMAHQLDNLRRSVKPLQIHWGDRDFALEGGHLDQVRLAAAGNKNCEIFIYPGVEHGYTGPLSPAWNPSARDVSFQRTLAMLERMKG